MESRIRARDEYVVLDEHADVVRSWFGDLSNPLGRDNVDAGIWREMSVHLCSS